MLKHTCAYVVMRWQHRGDRGATAVEYALLAALIAAIIAAVVGVVGTKTSTMFNSVTSGF